MRAFNTGLAAAVIFSACTTADASAMLGPSLSAATLHERARALSAVPNLTGVHTFTVLTRSKADRDVKAVAAYFERYGLHVQILAHTKNLLVSGTYGQAESAAHTRLQTLSLRRESVMRATSSPAFPASIATLIDGTSIVPGLHFRPLTVISAPSARAFYGPSATGYGPADIASIYDIAPVYRAGINGSGVNVAVAACSDVTVADVKQYGSDFNLPALQLTKTYVDGGPPAGVDGEAILDVERVYGTAPGANIFAYLAPDCTDSEIIDMFARIAEDTATYHFSGVSFSYGQDESAYAAAGMTSVLVDESAAIAQLAAAGVPLFAASGDSGSWNNELLPDVSYPASDTNAIAIGGTTALETSPTGRLREVGWGGSGGGVSSVFSIPRYQVGLLGASQTYKNVPDLAMVADPYAGVAAYAPDAFGAAAEVPIGGTSVAAPTFNGVWALVNSARHALGRAAITNAAAAIYGHPCDFLDVTAGANGAYTAHPGYDNMTGLGAPDVWRLVSELRWY